MRSSILILVGVLAGSVSQGGDGLITPTPNPECTYSRAAEQARSGPAVWHRASMAAELVAPTATSSGRHRAAVPPKGSPLVPANFIDTEIFGKMTADGVRRTGPSS